jgi:Putative stress-induced transcription regulator
MFLDAARRPCVVWPAHYHAGMPDPAPGPLHLVQSLADTLRDDPPTDLLSTREEGAAWLRAAGLLAADAGLSNSEYAALVRLRDAVRDVFAAHADGRADAEATARLTRALAEGRLVVMVDPDNTVRLASAARSSYPGIVAAFAVAIADSAATGNWPAG